eukprot:s434_g18.t1
MSVFKHIRTPLNTNMPDGRGKIMARFLIRKSSAGVENIKPGDVAVTTGEVSGCFFDDDIMNRHRSDMIDIWEVKHHLKLRFEYHLESIVSLAVVDVEKALSRAAQSALERARRQQVPAAAAAAAGEVFSRRHVDDGVEGRGAHAKSWRRPPSTQRRNEHGDRASRSCGSCEGKSPIPGL